MIFTLIYAIAHIEFQYGKEVVGIEYEDGSKRKFNVTFKGENKKTFGQGAGSRRVTLS